MFSVMEKKFSILSVVPIEELSVSKFVFDTVFLVTLLTFGPQMLGAIFAAITFSFIDRIKSGEYSYTKDVWMRIIGVLDIAMGVLLSVSLILRIDIVAGIGFAVFGLSYGMRSLLSQKVSMLLSTFHLFYFAMGMYFSYMLFVGRMHV